MGAIENFEAMLERGQDNDMLRFTLGSAYWKEKNASKAAEHLRAAVVFNPDYSAAWKVLGRALAELGELEAAREAFNSGLQAAANKGDKQNEKEITVFLKRVNKQLDTSD